MANSPGGVEIGRVSVRAVPDTSRLFEEFRADLDRIERNLSVDIRASVDSAELVASARSAVAEAQAAAGDIDVEAHVDTSQLDQLNRVVRDSTSATGNLLGSFSLLGAGAGLLSTALIPLTAVVGGLLLALAAPLAVVAGGVTIFGFLSGFAAKDTLAQLKKINDLDSKLSGLQKGTQEYADTLAQLQTAQAGLSPAQKAFADSLDRVKSAFSKLPQSALLKPLTQTLGLLADLLPKLTPIIDAVSGVFVDLIHDLDDVVRSPGFKKFIQAFAHDLGRDLKALAGIAGNLFIGLGGLFGALDDSLSQGVLKSLETLTKKFADFGRDAKNNKGLKSFVDYVKQNLPKVGDLIGNTFGVLGDALSVLAPLGSTALDFLNGILGAFQKLGQAAGPLAGAAALGGISAFFGGPEVGLAVAGVVALAGGLRELYKRSSAFRNILHDLGDYFKDTWLPKIQDAARNILPAFKDAFKDISDTFRDNKGLFEVLGKALVVIGSAAVIAGITQLVVGIRLIGKAFKFGTEAVKIWANATIDEFQFILRGTKVLIGIILGQFGLIVDSAAAAFGWIPKVGGQFNKARDQFHAFTDGINGDLDSADQTLQDLQDSINEVGRSHPSFKVDSNTLQVISQMHQLNALRLQDKNLKINVAIEQQIERVTGPGGGIQRPTGGGDARSGSGGGGRGGAAVQIDKAFFTDTNDVLRKADRRRRRRAGGAVVFPPARVTDFAGAR